MVNVRDKDLWLSLASRFDLTVKPVMVGLKLDRFDAVGKAFELQLSLQPATDPLIG